MGRDNACTAEFAYGGVCVAGNPQPVTPLLRNGEPVALPASGRVGGLWVVGSHPPS